MSCLSSVKYFCRAPLLGSIIVTPYIFKRIAATALYLKLSMPPSLPESITVEPSATNYCCQTLLLESISIARLVKSNAIIKLIESVAVTPIYMKISLSHSSTGFICIFISWQVLGIEH